jgi:2-keto-4-pentenoate hydratase
VSGLQQQLDERGRLIAAGAKPIGWKVGFGAPASLDLMQISAPLVGFLTDTTVSEPGSTVATDGWNRPIVEFEVAVYMGAELGADASEDEARRAVAAVGPAIELANIDLPLAPDSVPDIVAGNIFHEGVIFGRPDTDRAGLDISGLVARILLDGDERDLVTDLQALTGAYPWIVATVAATLAAHGERLRAGDVIITGSVIPPVPVAEATEFTFALDPFEPISVVVP